MNVKTFLLPFEEATSLFCPIVYLLCVLIFLPVNSLQADWNAGKTIEETHTRIAINVLDEGVRVEVTVSPEVLGAFNLGIQQFAERLINIDTNAPLSSEIKRSIEGASAHQLELWFAFAEPKPETLHISPDFNILKTTQHAYIISVAHHGLPVIDHDVLMQPETLQLNWLDPWLSHFLNPELKRDHGDPVMAFLYIEKQQTKAEVVVRVKELGEWLDLQLNDEKYISPHEYARIKQKAGEFLLTQNPLKADGVELQPQLERVDFIRMGAEDIQAYQPQLRQLQTTTLLGISVRYTTVEIPQQISWQWDLYNEGIQRVMIRAYDSAGLFDSYVTSDYRVFEWENMLADINVAELSGQQSAALVAVNNDQNGHRIKKLQIILVFLMLSFVLTILTSETMHLFALVMLIVLLGGGYMYWNHAGKPNVLVNRLLPEAQAKPVMQQLLSNIYQAFEAAEEIETYDKLALSVQGELIETLYLQNRQAFLIEDGAWSKVDKIEIKTLDNITSPFESRQEFDCQWLVIGQVIHWGHQHRRENLYRARISLTTDEGFWKITQLESLGQQRVDDAT